ncbi:MAG TPA: LacI family DNA-binding transcriptional regulator [Sediminibacterium sp.]|nr:LacI family DNA-binding transcriptional regulator [Sediminibacterium sp.]
MNTTTLKKIAETLGCSISTVSRALKHHPDISVKTREKVLELANTLDYEPNAFAIHLRTQNSKVIGLMVPFIYNQFYESFISSVEEESRKHGFALMILQTANDPLIEAGNLKLFRQNRVMGLFACITATTSDFSGFRKMGEQNIPVVYFDNVPKDAATYRVCLADERAATLAAEAMLQTGKKNIAALFGDPRLSITTNRQEAMEHFIRSKSPSTTLTAYHAANSEEAARTVQQILNAQKKPEVIFCMSDELLIGAMKVIQELQLKIPEQIGVISISNGFIPQLYYPRITYVETSGYKLGKLAFTHMMACISGASAVKELIQESVLIEGGSL